MTSKKHTSRSYFITSLLPNYDRFLECYENPTIGLSKDVASAAAVAEDCLNMADYVFLEERDHLKKDGILGSKKYREHLWKSQAAYEYICNFADARKHRALDRPSKKIGSIDDTQEVCGIIRYEDQQGFYYDARKLLYIHCLDGKTRDLAQMIFLSVKMWVEELLVLNKIDKPPSIRKLAPKFRSRAEVSQPPKMNYLGQEQETFSESVKLLVYDSVTDAFRDRQPMDKFKCEIQCTLQVGESPFG